MKFLLLPILLALPLFGKQSERYYQEKFAREIGGQVEVVMQDGTRCDILTATHKNYPTPNQTQNLQETLPVMNHPSILISVAYSMKSSANPLAAAAPENLLVPFIFLS